MHRRAIAGVLSGGTFATEIPYVTEIDLRVTITHPEPGMHTEHWLLPSVFTLAATQSGSDLALMWTLPNGDHGDITIDVTDELTNASVFNRSVPDTGALTVPAATFPHAGEYYVIGTRSHPMPSYNTMRIGTTYIHP